MHLSFYFISTMAKAKRFLLFAYPSFMIVTALEKEKPGSGDNCKLTIRMPNAESEINIC